MKGIQYELGLEGMFSEQFFKVNVKPYSLKISSNPFGILPKSMHSAWTPALLVQMLSGIGLVELILGVMTEEL